MKDPRWIIPEDGIVDYLICPMRYAFIWHYGVDPEDHRKVFWGNLRSNLSDMFKLMYEGRATAKNVKKVIVAEDSPSQYILEAAHNAAMKYVASVKDRNLVAYNMPVRHRIGQTLYAGMVDAVFVTQGSVIFARVNDLPSITTSKMEASLMGLAQLGLPANVRKEIQRIKYKARWVSLRVHGQSIKEVDVPEQEDTVPFLSSIGRSINNHVFYPRWYRNVCRDCKFATVCSPKWCKVEALRCVDRTRAQIKKEMA